MIKKIVTLLTFCSLLLSVYGNDLEEERLSLGAKIRIAAVTTVSVITDVVVQSKYGNACVQFDQHSMMIPPGIVLFKEEALEGPLTSKRFSKICYDIFFFLSMAVSPEFASGAYLLAYYVDKVAKQYGMNPVNRAACKYWSARVGGALSQVGFKIIRYLALVTPDNPFICEDSYFNRNFF